ncbi:N-6 DNA methylase [Thermoproteota archaeon]
MPSVNISEHTDRPDFINYLKERLGLKFRVFQEINFSDEKGSRHQADIVIFNSEKINVNLSSGELNWTTNDAVIAVIETKIHRVEALEQHESQLFNYMKIFRTKIGFLTNYSTVASYVKDKISLGYQKEIYNDDELENIAYFIVDVIEKVSQISIKRSPEEIMNFLESAIEDLTVFTSRISGDEWEANLRLSDASEIEEKKKGLSEKELENREKFLQRSAAYIAIAQIMFYITFRQFRIDENTNKNPNLAPLSAANGIPTQLQELLEEVPNNNLNFKAIFGKNKEVFSHLDDDAAPVLKSVVRSMEGISAKFVIENDLIGQIFQRLMPFETRKKFAAYYTIGKAAELICRLAIQDKNETVYDPACGSGTLLVNAYKRKRELGLNQHKAILQQIRGSDISDVATMMSTINLAIQDTSKWTNHVNIFQFNAIDFSFGMTRYQYHFRETPNGREEIDAMSAYDNFGQMDILLANPPFTRGSRLTQTQRDKLRKRFLNIRSLY